jgi:hypothetical protein
MDNLVRLKVVLAFGPYRVGDVIERIPSVAKVLLARQWYGRKLVEEIAAPVPVAALPQVVVDEQLPAIPTRDEPEPVESWPRSERKPKKKGQ